MKKNLLKFLIGPIGLAIFFAAPAARAYTVYATASTTVLASWQAGTITPTANFQLFYATNFLNLTAGTNAFDFALKDGATTISTSSYNCTGTSCTNGNGSAQAASPVLLAGHSYNFTNTRTSGSSSFFTNTNVCNPSTGNYCLQLSGNLVSDASYNARLKALHPLNGYTLPQMFNFQEPASSTLAGSAYIVEIKYSSPSNAYLWTDTLALTATGNITLFTIPPSAPQFGIVGQNVVWTATATLVYAGTLLDTTSSVWTIGPASSTLPEAACGITDVSCGMAKLFMPQNGFSQFSNLGTTYGKKPPFGYMASLTAAISGLETATSATSSVILMSTTTASAFSAVFSTLDLGLASVLAILALLWAIRRFRDFQP